MRTIKQCDALAIAKVCSIWRKMRLNAGQILVLRGYIVR
jgi:hypothetical protein